MAASMSGMSLLLTWNKFHILLKWCLGWLQHGAYQVCSDILVICLIWMTGFLSANAVRSGGPFFFISLCNSKLMKNSVKPLRKLLNMLNLIFLNFGNSTFVSSDELLVHFSATIPFYTPWKRQKTKRFLTFSGGIEMEQCAKMAKKK